MAERFSGAEEGEVGGDFVGEGGRGGGEGEGAGGGFDGGGEIACVGLGGGEDVEDVGFIRGEFGGALGDGQDFAGGNWRPALGGREESGNRPKIPWIVFGERDQKLEETPGVGAVKTGPLELVERHEVGEGEVRVGLEVGTTGGIGMEFGGLADDGGEGFGVFGEASRREVEFKEVPNIVTGRRDEGTADAGKAAGGFPESGAESVLGGVVATTRIELLHREFEEGVEGGPGAEAFIHAKSLAKIGVGGLRGGGESLVEEFFGACVVALERDEFLGLVDDDEGVVGGIAAGTCEEGFRGRPGGEDVEGNDGGGGESEHGKDEEGESNEAGRGGKEGNGGDGEADGGEIGIAIGNVVDADVEESDDGDEEPKERENANRPSGVGETVAPSGDKKGCE